MNLNLDPVRRKTHDAGRGHPRNLLQLLLALVKRYKEDVAADVAAHHLHDLGSRYIAQASHFNVVTRVQPESPRVFFVVIKHRRAERSYSGDGHSYRNPQQASGSFFRQGTAADRNALLRPQEWRFLLRVQVEQASVV